MGGGGEFGGSEPTAKKQVWRRLGCQKVIVYNRPGTGPAGRERCPGVARSDGFSVFGFAEGRKVEIT